MNLVVIALSALVGFILFSLIAPSAESLGLMEGVEFPLLRHVSTFLAVVAGVVLGSLYRDLSVLKAKEIKKIPKGFFPAAFRSVDMWLGLVGSPVVFALLLKTCVGMTLGGMVILGIENGFCCLIVLNQVLERKAQEPVRQE